MAISVSRNFVPSFQQVMNVQTKCKITRFSPKKIRSLHDGEIFFILKKFIIFSMVVRVITMALRVIIQIKYIRAGSDLLLNVPLSGGQL